MCSRLGDVPAAPLLRAVELRGGAAACGAKRSPALERALERAQVSGRLTYRAADQLAIRLLGLHPMLVWGDDWLG